MRKMFLLLILALFLFAGVGWGMNAPIVVGQETAIGASPPGQVQEILIANLMSSVPVLPVAISVPADMVADSGVTVMKLDPCSVLCLFCDYRKVMVAIGADLPERVRKCI